MLEDFYSAIRKHKAILAGGALAVTIIGYFYIVFSYSVNIPCSDDFEAILDVANNFSGATTSEKLKILLSLHMEHRIVFCRLVALVDKAIFGQVNFVRLIFYGNLSMLAFMWLFFKMLPDVENKLLYFIPIPFLFLNLQHYENAVWAMASLQNLWVVFFALFTLYMLNKGTLASLGWALLLGLVAVYTSGSGLFALISGLVLLLLSRRRALHISIWTIASSIIIYTYFIDYVSPYPDFKLSDAVFHSPDKIIADFFALAGSGLTFEKHYETAFNTTGFVTTIASGYAISVIFVFLLYKRYFFNNQLLFVALIFVVTCFASVAASRISFGAEYIADAGRYKINSLACYVILYLILVDTVLKKTGILPLLGIILISIVFWGLAYRGNIGTLGGIKGSLTRSSYVFFQEGSYKALVHWEPEGKAARILKLSEEKGLYTMPNLSLQFLPPAKSDAVDVQVPDSGDQVACAFDINYTESSGTFYIQHGWALLKDRNSGGNKIFVVLKSDTETKVFETEQEDRKDVTAFFQGQEVDAAKKSDINFDQSGFNFAIARKDLTPGREYSVGILIEADNGEKYLHFPGKTLK